MTTLRKIYDIAYFKALPDQGNQTGRFEALVSVFGNVDYQGDRVMSGAFDATLKTWRASGDPIPVVFSHDWGDPFAFVGTADPNDCEEIAPGQKAGQPKGGLLVRGKIFVNQPYAAQVHFLLKERLIKQWSFAYDVIDESTAEDKANNLNVLDLLEVGPCLSGANPLTDTLNIKARLDDAAKRQSSTEMISKAMAIDPVLAKALLREAVREIVTVKQPLPGTREAAESIDPNLADLLYGAKEQHNGGIDGMREHMVAEHGMSQEAADGMSMDELKAAHADIKHEGDEEKSRDALPLLAKMREHALKYYGEGLAGSWEETEQDVGVAVQAWADKKYGTDAEGDTPWAMVVGTFSDHVVFGVGGYDMEYEYWSATYTRDADGTVTLGTPTAMAVELTAVPAKERTMDTKASGFDEGAWDGAAALASASNAAEFGKIAFRRNNDSDPDTAAAWALPHHSSPGADPNVKGVSAALGSLNGGRGGAPDLKDTPAARSHLEAHQTAYENTQKDEGKITVNAAREMLGLPALDGEKGQLWISLGAKSGKVIGAKAAQSLHDHIDSWVTEVNGGSTEEAAKEDPPEVKNEDPDADIKARLAELDSWTKGKE
jgi:HK97 family phage prohead protease